MAKLAKTRARAVTRKHFTADGFDNVVARLGMGQKNILAQSRYRRTRILEREELLEMYQSSWVVGRVVEIMAQDMVRAGISLQGDYEPDEAARLLGAFQELGLWNRLDDALKWGRLFGGGLAILQIEGQDLASPLDLDSVGPDAFRGLFVLDRYEVTPSLEIIRDLGPMLGYPAAYTINAEGLEGVEVHYSRVLRFVGIEQPKWARLREQHWGASVVTRLFSLVAALDASSEGAANLMLKSHLRTLGIRGLRDILATGGDPEKGLLRMMDMNLAYQTNEGVTLLDADDTFATHGWSFSGVYDVLQAFSEQIAGATSIPLVRLLGQSPKGFSTGHADLQVYYETVATAQETALRSPVGLLLELVSRSVLGKPLPSGASFAFNPLATPSEVEKAQIATADAQAVAALLQTGVLDGAQALRELKERATVTGRFSSLSEEDIEAARSLGAAPALPPDFGE